MSVYFGAFWPGKLTLTQPNSYTRYSTLQSLESTLGASSKESSRAASRAPSGTSSRRVSVDEGSTAAVEAPPKLGPRSLSVDTTKKMMVTVS